MRSATPARAVPDIPRFTVPWAQTLVDHLRALKRRIRRTTRRWGISAVVPRECGKESTRRQPERTVQVARLSKEIRAHHEAVLEVDEEIQRQCLTDRSTECGPRGLQVVHHLNNTCARLSVVLTSLTATPSRESIASSVR